MEKTLLQAVKNKSIDSIPFIFLEVEYLCICAFRHVRGYVWPASVKLFE